MGHNVSQLASQVAREMAPLLGLPSQEGGVRPTSSTHGGKRAAGGNLEGQDKRPRRGHQISNPNSELEVDEPEEIDNFTWLAEFWPLDDRPELLKNRARVNSMPMKLIIKLRSLHELSEKNSKGILLEL